MIISYTVVVGSNENRGHVSDDNHRRSVNASNASANAELSNVYLLIVPVTFNGDSFWSNRDPSTNCGSTSRRIK